MSKIINRHGNFTLVPNGFFEADLTHETFRLYVVLLSYAKGNATDGGDVFPAYDALKDKTRIKHNKTIANALRALEELGWLERRKRFGASTIYTLTSPSPRDVMEDAPVSHRVTRSMSRRDVQYVTPSKANNTQLTKHTKQNKSTGASAPPAATPLNRLLFTAISEVCLMDSSAKSNAARIGKCAGWLAGKPGIKCEHVHQFGSWWNANDWRGQKGERPTPEFMMSEWAKFAAGYKPKPSRTNGKTWRLPQTPAYTPERAAEAERKARIREMEDEE